MLQSRQAILFGIAAQLYEAADAVNNDRIFQLIASIPDEYSALGKAIANLANNFRCDKIIDLIDEFRNGEWSMDLVGGDQTLIG